MAVELSPPLERPFELSPPLERPFFHPLFGVSLNVLTTEVNTLTATAITSAIPAIGVTKST
jgi:hypothetical protein